MVSAALVAGLYPKILVVEGGNGLKTLGNNQVISIVRDCPTSVASGTDANGFDSIRVRSISGQRFPTLERITWYTIPLCNHAR